MSIDRDLFIDTFYNVAKFEAEGLPVETRWHTGLRQSFRGDCWLDPKGKDFGPNAKYFKHDVAEAKKLLAAAGYANGFEYNSVYPEGTAYGADFPKQLEVIEGMTSEAGIKPKATPIDYTTEYIPKYRDGHGQLDGIAYKLGPGYATDAIARFVYEFSVQGRQHLLRLQHQRQGRPVRRPGDRRADREGRPRRTSRSARLRRRHPAPARQGAVDGHVARRRHQLPHGLARGAQLPDLSRLSQRQQLRAASRYWLDRRSHHSRRRRI